MGGQTRQHTLTMVFEELPIVATETTVATKRLIRKETLARTAQKTWAKKKPAKKAAKKPKAKKAKKAKKKKKKKKKKAKKKKKKRKKKKAKKLRYPGGHRVKHAPKSKKKSISGKASRLAITKAVWAYIKKKGLNKGRNVGKIDGIFGGGSMFKLAGAVAKHVK